MKNLQSPTYITIAPSGRGKLAQVARLAIGASDEYYVLCVATSMNDVRKIATALNKSND